MGFNPRRLPTKNSSNSAVQIRSDSIGSALNEAGVDNLVGSNANFPNISVDPRSLNHEMEDLVTGDFDPHFGPKQPFLSPNPMEPKQFSNQSRSDSLLNLSLPYYQKLATGKVLRYTIPRCMGFVSVRVVGFDRDLVPIPGVNKSHSSFTIPEEIETVCFNFSNIQNGCFENACSADDIQPSPMHMIDASSPFIMVSPTNFPKPFTKLENSGNSSGLGISQLVRPCHQTLPWCWHSTTGAVC